MRPKKSKSKAPKLAPAPVAPKPTTVLCPVPIACPPGPSYVPPTNCAAPVCYNDMGKLVNDIKIYLDKDGSTFNGTVCPGTWTWGVTDNISIEFRVKFQLFCCGQANTCIIDGGSPALRSSGLFFFNLPSDINIQGITFQNFTGVGAILESSMPSVVILKYNIFRNLQSDVSTRQYILSASNFSMPDFFSQNGLFPSCRRVL